MIYILSSRITNYVFKRTTKKYKIGYSQLEKLLFLKNWCQTLWFHYRVMKKNELRIRNLNILMGTKKSFLLNDM